MKTIVLLFVSLLLACPEKAEAPKVEKEKTVDVKKEATKVLEKKVEEKKVEIKQPEKSFLQLKYSKKDLPETVKFSGKAKHGLRWEDKNGENWFVLSESQKTTDHHGTKYTYAQNLYATHVAIKGGEAKVLRTIKEIKPECEFDWSADFDTRSISILDLDKDGYGEATFSYRTNCTSDVSPGTYKLFVLENGEKNILRGSELLAEKQYQAPGDGTFKSEGFKASKELLDHAKSVWDKTKIAKATK